MAGAPAHAQEQDGNTNASKRKYTTLDLRDVQRLFDEITFERSEELSRQISALKEQIDKLQTQIDKQQNKPTSGDASDRKKQVEDLSAKVDNLQRAVNDNRALSEAIRDKLAGLNPPLPKSPTTKASPSAPVSDPLAAQKAIAEIELANAEKAKAEAEGGRARAEADKLKAEEQMLGKDHGSFWRQTSFWTVVVPVFIAALSLFGQAWLRAKSDQHDQEMRAKSDQHDQEMEGKRFENKLKQDSEQSKRDFQLKVAEILMASKSSRQMQARADALKNLFGDNFDENFGKSFDPNEMSLARSVERKEFLMQLISEDPERAPEIVTYWKLLFPEARWINEAWKYAQESKKRPPTETAPG